MPEMDRELLVKMDSGNRDFVNLRSLDMFSRLSTRITVEVNSGVAKDLYQLEFLMLYEASRNKM